MSSNCNFKDSEDRNYLGVKNMANQLATYETLDLHEIMNFKTVCMTKASTMQGLISDPQLKTLLQQDVEQSKMQIQQIQGQLSNVNLQ